MNYYPVTAGAKHPVLYRYALPSEKGEGWAIVVLGSDGTFMAISDWGNYAYWWSAHGCADFRSFLLSATRSEDYFVGKLAPGGDEYDGEATEKAIRRRILQSRREGTLSRDEAREEWTLLLDCDLDRGEAGFALWHDRTALADAYELCQRVPNRQATMFVRKVLGRLIPILLEELGAETGRVSP